MVLYKFLNVFFFVFHISLILFNVFGWMFKPLQRANLITLSLTLFSWVVLGFFYGFGYCFLTDWHWNVREKLGYVNESNSYIHFLVTRVVKTGISERTTDVVTVVVLAIAVVMSVFANVRRWKKK